jgi:hypothetical protein
MQEGALLVCAAFLQLILADQFGLSVGCNTRKLVECCGSDLFYPKANHARETLCLCSLA